MEFTGGKYVCFGYVMKNKIIYLALIVTLFLGTDGIYASKQSAVNNLDSSVVNIEINEYMLDETGEKVPWIDDQEVLPGMEVSKIPCFTATGNDCYIRATVNTVMDAETDHPITADSLRGISEEWIRKGNYFYYKYPLRTGESVEFFHSFKIPSEWGNDMNPANIGDWGFSITITVDAVQAEHFAPDFESNSPWGEINIQESIHAEKVFVDNPDTGDNSLMTMIWSVAMAVSACLLTLSIKKKRRQFNEKASL